MKRRLAQNTWTAAALLSMGFCVFFPTVLAQETGPSVLTAGFDGRVIGADGQPVAGVEIMTYHLATAALYTARTDMNGTFTLPALPYGYFDLAARPSDGLYVADQVAQVSASGRNSVELRLQQLGGSAQAELRAFAGANEAPIGIALLIDQPGWGSSFWRSPRGVATLAGSGALALILTGGGSDPPTSPFMPANSP